MSAAPESRFRVMKQLPPQIQNDDPEAFRRQRMRMNRSKLDAAGFGSAAGGRGDSDVSDSYHLARQLEHIYDEVVTQQFRPAGAFDLFPLDNRVPPGARTHTVERLEFTGEPRVYRSTDAASPDRGRADVRQDDDSFNVRYYVMDVPLDYFDELHSDFAQRSLRDDLTEAAEISMSRFATRKVWLGDDANGIKGIYNYNWLQKLAFSQALVDDPSDDERTEIKDMFIRAEQFVIENSETRATPNRAVTSARVRNYLSRKDRSPNYQGSLLEDITGRLAEIDDFEMDQDLKNIGGEGIDGVLFYTNQRRAIANVVPEPFSMLPVRERGSFDLVIPTYMAHGGIVMRDPWANLLMLVDTNG